MTHQSIIKVSLIFIVSSFLFFCEEETNLEGRYQYSGFDAQGIKIITGSFSIEYGDSTEISGDWIFDAIGDPKNIGPQIGSGHFIGTIDKQVFSVNLNPQFVDNNVNLVGTLAGNQITGEWVYSGFPGILNQGVFTAEK